MPNRHRIGNRLVSMSDSSSAAGAASTVSVRRDSAVAIASTGQMFGAPGPDGYDLALAVARPAADRLEREAGFGFLPQHTFRCRTEAAYRRSCLRPFFAFHKF